jgi:hypothetical protein
MGGTVSFVPVTAPIGITTGITTVTVPIGIVNWDGEALDKMLV